MYSASIKYIDSFYMLPPKINATATFKMQPPSSTTWKDMLDAATSVTGTPTGYWIADKWEKIQVVLNIAGVAIPNLYDTVWTEHLELIQIEEW